MMPMMLPLALVQAADGPTGLFVFHRGDGPTRLAVRPGEQTSWSLDSRLCGNFLEHLGGVIYDGVWAQCLQNPTCEPLDDRRFDRLKDRFELYLGRRTPIPWAPLDGTAVTSAPDATVNQQALHLSCDGRGGIGQEAVLPLHRARTYHGRLFLRSTRPPQAVRVKVAQDDHEWASATLPTPTAEWQSVELALDLSAMEVKRNQVRFAVEVDGPGELELDNLELYPDDAVDGLDPDILRLAREWRMPILRYPGGNFASGYHWRDGVGPHDRRPTKPNPAWGGLEVHTFGTDEFMRFCELIGTQPMITVNIGDGTPEEAAAWVQYCNGAATTPLGQLRTANGHRQPYNVRVWEVGNEIYGDWQIGHCDAAENVRRYNAFARAMLAVDPGLELIATGCCGNEAWNQALLDDAAPLTCYSEHPLVGPWNMPRDETPEQFWPRLAAHPWWYWRDYLAPHRLRLHTAGRAVTVAVTEWGIIGGGDPRNLFDLPHAENQAGAVYAGCLMNALLRSGRLVKIANITGLLHGGGLRRNWGIAYADPQYYVSRLFVDAMGGRLVGLTETGPGYDCDGRAGLPAVSEVPWVDAAAVRSADGATLYLFLVNRSWGEARTVELELGAFTPQGYWRVESAEGPLARNDVSHRERITAVWHESTATKLDLPPMSVTRLDAR